MLTAVEEHVSHGCGLPVHLEWVSAQNNALRDNAGGVCVQETTHRDKLGSFTMTKTLVRNILRHTITPTYLEGRRFL